MRRSQVLPGYSHSSEGAYAPIALIRFSTSVSLQFAIAHRHQQTTLALAIFTAFFFNQGQGTNLMPFHLSSFVYTSTRNHSGLLLTNLRLVDPFRTVQCVFTIDSSGTVLMPSVNGL